MKHGWKITKEKLTFVAEKITYAGGIVHRHTLLLEGSS
jgi:hypothetical protein